MHPNDCDHSPTVSWPFAVVPTGVDVVRRTFDQTCLLLFFGPKGVHSGNTGVERAVHVPKFPPNLILEGFPPFRIINRSERLP